ncbi:hypothetical protein CsSME_00025546 [Camellia sinensis var. sinensis]
MSYSASNSAPPLPLLSVFAIVIFFLSLSQYTNYKTQIMEHTKSKFQLFFPVLLPILVVLILLSGLTNGMTFGFWSSRPEHHHQRSGSPWGVAAVLVAVLLLLVSYGSSFYPKWFLG